MTDLITQVWSALRDAGLPEVMLFLPDGSAYRCHRNDTSLIGSIRVAILADQDRKIVRIMPIEECKGIGIASPKGNRPDGLPRLDPGKAQRVLRGQGRIAHKFLTALLP